MPPRADVVVRLVDLVKRSPQAVLVLACMYFGFRIMARLDAIGTDIAIVRATVAPHVAPATVAASHPFSSTETAKR